MSRIRLLLSSSRYIALFALGSFQLTRLSLDTKPYTWGWNNFGQLGLGHFTTQYTPQQVVALQEKSVAMVAGSGSASAILTHDGRVFTWGKSKSGLLGHPKSSENNLNIPTLVEGLNGHVVKYISCGNNHMAVITNTGEIWTWGNPDHGKLGHSFGQTDPTVQKHHYHTGNVFNRGEVPQKVPFAHPVKSIVCSNQHTVCVTESGEVYTWGLNKRGSLGMKTEQQEVLVPTKVKLPEKIVKVDAGSDFTLALSESGVLYAWGSNYFGQLGHPNSLYLDEPNVVSGFPQLISDFACGDQFVGALDKDGRIYTWGYGGDGQLGFQNKQHIPVPSCVEFTEPVKAISCGIGHVGIITRQHQLYMFGRGKEVSFIDYISKKGQLGRGTEIESSNSYRIAPQLVEVFKGRKVLQVSCAGSHTLALIE